MRYYFDSPGQTISKLKELHHQVFQRVNLGRLLMFLKLTLKELELEQLYHMP